MNLVQDVNYQVNSSGPGVAIAVVLALGLGVFSIVCVWRVYTKAGQPGWASIIPFYNLWVLLKIVRRPGWWFLLLLIPFVNFVFIIILAVDLAKAFGHGGWFAVGLIFLSVIFYAILAFGSATYQYVGGTEPSGGDVAPTAQ